MVKVEHLSKSFGTQQALNDICFTLQDGEIVGLLGPNGAGKTTLMKLLIGLLQPDQTTGADSMPALISCPRPIGYLPEQNPLYQEMYVREYLRFMDSLCREHSDVEALIERVGLTREAHKPIHLLSKGYKQRVGLAQALLGNPQLLILDEPTTGLDPNQLEDIRRIIREEGGKRTVILSTHILQEVQQMCSRVIILSQGQIKADKQMSDIDDLPQLFHQMTN
ncbi:MAG: ATP-binding cassette domain-containing protein [Paludibacteraceae bacterium]|nr:ATP-binding cassette domain-containing protein [Paludibacteraceae bacterium]